MIDALRSALGARSILLGNDVGERHRSDASRTGKDLPRVLLRPDSVEAVASALRICSEHRQPITIQGGLTGLAGGANPQAGDIALSLDRLAGVEEIDTASATMTVRAGTILETAQRAAEDAGFLLPIDLGARGSCQIGGVISTNAGGIRAFRHGLTRENVLGLEVVLADGTVLIALNKALKNNTGYDLRQLFIGSEGTLGVVTRAVLRLRPLPVGRSTALCAAPGYRQVLELLDRVRGGLPGLSAFEVMWASFFDFIELSLGQRHFDAPHPFAIIVEQEHERAGVNDLLEEILSGCLEDGILSDCLIAQSEKERAAFWEVREGHVLDTLPDLVNLDISLPVGQLDDFAQNCGTTLLARFPGAHVSFFGHLGDGNLHVAVSVPDASDTDLSEISHIAYGLVRERGGSISAEHGIGILKRPYLSYSRGEAELDIMRRMKAALDPNGILNPGKVI